jgi:hypothetical protein
MESVTLISMNRNPAEDVRYRRNSGKHLLVLSFSQFDPTETFTAPERLMLSMRAFCSIKRTRFGR